MKTKRICAAIAAICAATALSPSWAETHTLQPYAYVQSQSYGSNVVYTAYYASKDSKFVADFEFVGTDAGVVFGANNNGGNLHAFYINGNGKIAWTMNGEHFIYNWNPGNAAITPRRESPYHRHDQGHGKHCEHGVLREWRDVHLGPNKQQRHGHHGDVLDGDDDLPVAGQLCEQLARQALFAGG